MEMGIETREGRAGFRLFLALRLAVVRISQIKISI